MEIQIQDTDLLLEQISPLCMTYVYVHPSRAFQCSECLILDTAVHTSRKFCNALFATLEVINYIIMKSLAPEVIFLEAAL